MQGNGKPLKIQWNYGGSSQYWISIDKLTDLRIEGIEGIESDSSISAGVLPNSRPSFCVVRRS
jgi:hypothetical protein